MSINYLVSYEGPNGYCSKHIKCFVSRSLAEDFKSRLESHNKDYVLFLENLKVLEKDFTYKLYKKYNVPADIFSPAAMFWKIKNADLISKLNSIVLYYYQENIDNFIITLPVDISPHISDCKEKIVIEEIELEDL